MASDGNDDSVSVICGGGVVLQVADSDDSDSRDLRDLLEAAGYRVQEFADLPAPDAGASLRASQRLQDLQEQVSAERERSAELRHRAQEQAEFRQAAEARAADLSARDEIRDQFIATASHEIKGPLTSIRGYSQLLLRQLGHPPLDPALLAQGLAEIDAQADAIARLVDSLLDVSRIQAGSLALQLAPTTIGDCIAAVTASLNPDERRRIDLSLPAAPLCGRWEARKVETVLGNLLRNALKYSPPAEPVSLRASQVQEEVEVAITDRGLGIAADELPRLFDRFYRTAEVRASDLPGTGLGLYICRNLVEAHGGRLWAESAGKGQGATFRFRLPSADGCGEAGLTPDEATGAAHE